MRVRSRDPGVGSAVGRETFVVRGNQGHGRITAECRVHRPNVSVDHQPDAALANISKCDGEPQSSAVTQGSWRDER